MIKGILYSRSANLLTGPGTRLALLSDASKDGVDIAQLSMAHAMGIPDPNFERYLISNARERARELLTSFAANGVVDVGTDVLCARVGAVFEEYCAALLDGLQSAVLPVDATEAQWVRDHYVPMMVEFATALRDAIADSKARHAAAQLIQCKVLEHERQVRIVLEPASTRVSAPQLTSPMY